MTTAVMRFPGDRIASFTCSVSASDRSAFEVVCTKGVEMAATLKAGLTVGGRTVKRAFPKRDQFAPELIYFADCILSNRDRNRPVSKGWPTFVLFAPSCNPPKTTCP